MKEDEWKEILRQTSHKLWNLFKRESSWKTDLKSDSICVGCVSAGITFPVCLAVVQSSIFLPLRISSRFPKMASIFGCASVGFSGTVSSVAFISSALATKWITEQFEVDNLLSSLPFAERTVQFSFSKYDLLIYALGSVALFKGLQGRFRHCVPSHLFYPGSYAKQSVPAFGTNYATDSSKRKLYIIGRKYGCHSCGRKWQKSFIGDHQPPNKLVKTGQKQVFYPHCARCSNRQGGALSSMKKRLFIKTHATSLRLCHLWFPLPLAVSSIKSFL